MRHFIPQHVFDHIAPAPSSTKPQKTNFIIKNVNNKPAGCVRFGFMFPIPANRRAVKDSHSEDYQRMRLLLEDYQYCNRKAKQIVSKAQHVYRMATTGSNPDMAAVCCLEQHLSEREG